MDRFDRGVALRRRAGERGERMSLGSAVQIVMTLPISDRTGCQIDLGGGETILQYADIGRLYEVMMRDKGT